jgi:hypothetical protein
MVHFRDKPPTRTRFIYEAPLQSDVYDNLHSSGMSRSVDRQLLMFRKQHVPSKHRSTRLNGNTLMFSLNSAQRENLKPYAPLRYKQRRGSYCNYR